MNVPSVHKMIRPALALIMGSLLLVSPGTAQEKDKTNSGEKGTTTPAATAVADLRLAQNLIEYGRRQNSPEALITAARILGTTPTQEFDVEKRSRSDADHASDGQSADKKSDAPDNSPQALLEEAKRMGHNDLHIAELCQQAADAIEEGTRGAVGGPKGVLSERVKAHHTDVYEVVFRGGETARVLVRGDHDTDLDLYIYDENGNLVDSDTDMTDICLGEWTPRWTGKFRIEIENLGDVYNEYDLVTN